MRAGIIGLDTSHSPAFARILNAPDAADDVYDDLGYVDVLWNDSGDAGVDIATLDADDIAISGVTIAADQPTHEGGGVWRYAYAGELLSGSVTVDFMAGEVIDLAGNPNPGYSEAFTFTPLEITTPASLPPAAIGSSLPRKRFW